MKLKAILNSLLTENKYTVYHGSNTIFRNFNLKLTAQGIAWFSDSIDDITSGNAGAQSSKHVMEFQITLNNPAGWDEYEKYGIGELKDMKYDGVILKEPGYPTNYIVFDKKNIKFIKSIR